MLSLSRSLPSPSTSSAAAAGAGPFVSVTVIVDDLVFPDGRTSMARTGGGGAQACFGALVWDDDEDGDDASGAALVAGVGRDLPGECREWLDRCGIDVRGLVTHASRSTPRAWQIMEADGRRREVWRTPDAEMETLGSMLRVDPRDVPADLLTGAAAVHVALDPTHADQVDWLDAFLGACGSGEGGPHPQVSQQLRSAEPYCAPERALRPDELHFLFRRLDVWSPNAREAEASLHGTSGGYRGAGGGAEGVVARAVHNVGLLALAASETSGRRTGVICIRCGEHGAVVADLEAGRVHVVPAVHREGSDNAVDPTGCGNAFCGGFAASLAGARRGKRVHEQPAVDPILWAGVCGAVSSSFMLEHVAVPPADVLPLARRDAPSRAAHLLPCCTTADLVLPV